MRERYEEHHQLKITDEALRSAADLAARYVTDRFLPDKAIDLIDEAASRVRLRSASAPPALKEALRGLEEVTRQKDEAIAGAGIRGRGPTARRRGAGQGADREAARQPGTRRPPRTCRW